MHYDLLIASASAGLLVYSGRLLVPAARLRPEDIIADKYLPGGRSYSVERFPSGEFVGYTQFPENDTLLEITDVVNSKIGFDLLVFGTIGSVLAIIVGALLPSRQVLSRLDISWAVLVFVAGIVAGWWATTRSGWRGWQERSLLVHCFLAWLEREVGDPKAKGYEFGLVVAGTIRHSGFTLIKEARAKGVNDTGMPRWVVDLARKYRYAWRRDDFRKWAGQVAGKALIEGTTMRGFAGFWRWLQARLFYSVLAIAFCITLLSGFYLWGLPDHPSNFHNDALLSGVIGALLGAILTLLLAYVAWRQIYQVSRTESASFVLDIKNEFFRLDTRTLVHLLVEDLLEFVPSTADRLEHFRVNQDGIGPLAGSYDEERVRIPRRYSVYEVDDLLLGHFEDLGLLHRMGIVEIEMIYGMFSWYVRLAWNNEAIQNYIASERHGPDGADIYKDFEHIYNACANYR